ncbi:TetR/AcrR family transcriptional regulator [Burkholderia sp. 3C]
MDNASAILVAAMLLLEEQGPDGLTTRAVCEAAGIKSPTLYHYFGGKEGLERALIERGVAEFMQKKRLPPENADPLDQLRSGWDIAVDFALKRPALWRLFAQHAIVHPDLHDDGYALMRSRVQRLVDLGRFQGTADAAAQAVWAANQGVLALITAGHAPNEVRAMSAFMFQAVTARLMQVR